MTTENDDADLYVYGLAEPGLPRQLTILRQSLRTLPVVAGIDAVVARPHSPPPNATAESLRKQHAIVAALADTVSALLPARFGSVASARTLRGIVSSRQSEVLQALTRVRGCDQMTIRVFGAPEDREVGPPASSGTEFLQQRRARVHYAPPETATIHAELGDYVKAERHAAGERGLRLTVFHLVPRGQLERYLHRATGLQQKLAPHTVTVTGPWPVFAFAPELV